MAATRVLHDRVPCVDHPGRAEPFRAARLNYILVPKKWCDDVLNAWVNFLRGVGSPCGVGPCFEVRDRSFCGSAVGGDCLLSLCCVVQFCSGRFALGCDAGGSDVSFVADPVGVIDQLFGSGAASKSYVTCTLCPVVWCLPECSSGWFCPGPAWTRCSVEDDDPAREGLGWFGDELTEARRGDRLGVADDGGDRRLAHLIEFGRHFLGSIAMDVDERRVV